VPFKLPPSRNAAADNAEALLRDLRNRKIAGLLSHQADIIRAYHKLDPNVRDVALQLPTGSGKTLVGLLIAEWHRQKHGHRVVYLCPTRQLVNQVVEQAKERYGIEAIAFTGRQKEYPPVSRSAYNSADSVAVTTYNGLFNTNSFFGNAAIGVFDDAHAAENYVAGTWSLTIRRSRHKVFFEAFIGAIGSLLAPTDQLRFNADRRADPVDRAWVECIPFERLESIGPQLVGLIDTHASASDDHKYEWSLLRPGFHASSIYVSTETILVRPLIPPTWTHAPFANLKQRVYMSATLGESGDLERLWGVEKITRLEVPAGWDKQGIGRRLFLFPELSLADEQARKTAYELIKKVPRATVLVTDNDAEESVGEEIHNETGYTIYDAEQIEDSKANFVNSTRAVAVMASRYDGIDLSEDECRLLVLWGLPRALNLQEKFLNTRMAATLLLEDRVLTRVIQGAGRCTRTPTDYAGVVILGYDLTRFLEQKDVRQLLHPELQAEMEFGIEQSRGGATAATYAEYLSHLLARNNDWQAADAAILGIRQGKQRETRPAATKLRAAVEHEVHFQKDLWNGRYEEALDAARRVLSTLNGPEVQGYRAFWNYLAGSAAYYAFQKGAAPMRKVATEHYRAAMQALPSVSWLVELSRSVPGQAGNEAASESMLLSRLVVGLETALEAIGSRNARNLESRFKTIADGLAANEAKQFEPALAQLGHLLGYEAELAAADDAAPDVLWRIGQDLCFVFEAHTNVSDPRNPIGANKVRQAKSHPDWVWINGRTLPGGQTFAILVSPCVSITTGARPHVDSVFYWNKTSLQQWATEALNAIRELWRTFPGTGDPLWRDLAAQAYIQKKLEPSALLQVLKKTPLSVLPTTGDERE